MRALTVAALFAAALPAVHAQAQTAPGDPDILSNRIFEALKRGTTADVLNAIAEASPLLFKNKEGAKVQIAAQIDTTIASYGPVVRWERIGTEMLGTLVRRDTYVVQHRDMVVRWHFVYMKLDRGWTIANFNFDDQAVNWFPGAPAK
jgi:hypothetical protein